ncbi:MFS transporter [Actinomadura sp. 3N407]|uniref:MFS transporter n=1 Tax=Actinomadura sp. 3N407 TaxID=3457423 RepID=UPI003FCE2FCD
MLTLSTDLTVLFFALPTLSADLDTSASEALWIVHVYGFVIAGTLITMGRLGDRIGPRRLLLTGSAAFAATSILAAFSVNAEMLITARALLGVAGATLMPSPWSTGCRNSPPGGRPAPGRPGLTCPSPQPEGLCWPSSCGGSAAYVIHSSTSPRSATGASSSRSWRYCSSGPAWSACSTCSPSTCSELSTVHASPASVARFSRLGRPDARWSMNRPTRRGTCPSSPCSA